MAKDRQGVGGTGVGLIDTLISFFLIFLSWFIFWVDFFSLYLACFGWITTTDITHHFHSDMEYTFPPTFPSSHPFYDL